MIFMTVFISLNPGISDLFISLNPGISDLLGHSVLRPDIYMKVTQGQDRSLFESSHILIIYGYNHL